MEYKGIKLTLDMETKDFDSAVKRVKTSTNALNEDLKNLKNAFKFDPTNIEVYNNYITKLKGKIEDLSSASNFLTDVLGQVPEGSSRWNELVSVIANLQRNIELTNNEIEEADGLFADFNTSVEYSTKNAQEFNDALEKQDKELDEGDKNFRNINDDLDEYSENTEEAGEATIKFSDLIESNLISDAIMSGIRKLISLTKELAGVYVDTLKTGIEYNASMETYTTSIRAMLNGDEEAAMGVVNAMKEINSESSFSNDALLESAQQLIASDIAADEATKSIRDMAKALAYAGKGDNELKRMAQNLNQIKNASKASAMDLKQFAYAGIPIYKLLAEYDEKRFGNGVDSKEDPATYEDIVNALAKAAEEGGKFYDAFTTQAGTYNYELNKIKTNWLNLAGVIAEDATSALSQVFLPTVNETLENMKKGFEEDGIQGMLKAFSEGLSEIAPVILEKAPELFQDGIDIINGIVDGLLEEDEEGRTILEKAAEELVEILTEWSLDPDTWLKLFDVGWNLAKGIAKGFLRGLFNIFKDNPELSEAFSGSFGSIGSDLYNSGGFGSIQSGGFGALQSGGYGNITLNASFIANGNLDEAQAMRFADLMVDRVNEQLGQMIGG